MAQTSISEYFYGEESEQFSYFRIPRLLVRSKKFKTLSTYATLLHRRLPFQDKTTRLRASQGQIGSLLTLKCSTCSCNSRTIKFGGKKHV